MRGYKITHDWQRAAAMTDRMRVLLVDDEPLALAYLRSVLEAESDVNIVSECNNGRKALRYIEQNAVDLVFLDIQMPGMSGFELLENTNLLVVQVSRTSARHNIHAVIVTPSIYLCIEGCRLNYLIQKGLKRNRTIPLLVCYL